MVVTEIYHSDSIIAAHIACIGFIVNDKENFITIPNFCF
jgi:hypothetical protein